MSSINFQQNFQNRLLEKLEDEMRKKVEKQKGQLLILPGPNELKKAVEDTFGRDVVITNSQYRSAIKKAREQAKKLHELFKSKNKERYATLKQVLDSGRMGLPSSYVLGKNMFIVTSFNYSINSVKKAMLKHFTDNNILTDTQKEQLQKNIHKGHGVKGSAVSQVQIANAVTSIPLEYTDSLEASFDSWAKQGNIPNDIRTEISKLITNHRQIVTPDGELTDDYVSNVVFQFGKENVGKDAALERKIKGVFRDFANEYAGNLVNEEGSSTLKQKVTKVLMTKLSSGKNVKASYPDKNVSLKTTHKSTVKGKRQKTKRAKIISKSATKRVTFNTSPASMPFQLIGVFNKELPRVVEKNMESPRLNYQSGRFASSVRVTDIVQTPKGFPSIGYTYMKSPYQTFEPGYKQGSVERDPRKLIDYSIREIAIQFALGRFYTRRV